MPVPAWGSMEAGAAADAHPDVTDVVHWDSPGLTVTTSRSCCPAGGWGHEHEGGHDGIALPIRGAFRRRVDGRPHLVSPAVGFFRRAGEVTSVAHFSADEHAGTILDVDPELTTPVLREAGTTGPFIVTPPIARCHRHLAASLRRRRPDAMAVEEQTMALLGLVLEHRVEGFDSAASTRTTAAVRHRRRVVDEVCRLLQHDTRLGLRELATAVSYSPFHLSRLFRREVGTTLSAYRTNLVVHDVLLRLDAGERDLHRLAADTGFADHSHLTRTVRRTLDATPSALRSELAALSGS